MVDEAVLFTEEPGEGSAYEPLDSLHTLECPAHLVEAHAVLEGTNIVLD